MKLFDLRCFELALKVELRVFRYAKGGNLGIMMVSWENGKAELWGALTVNLVNIPPKKDCAFIDINNNGEEIRDWIVRNGLGIPTGRIAIEGYCIYPDILKKLDYDGYMEYLKHQKLHKYNSNVDI